jgi:oxygen-independent coproporphyrinogen-3 oxidase
MEEILAVLGQVFEILDGAEISLEANPGTLSLEYLHSLRQMGVTRLSLGMQSASPEELRLLERQHGFGDVVRTVSWARQAGFENLNLDLIFGLPEQTVESWQRNLGLAAQSRAGTPLSLCFDLEHGTPLDIGLLGVWSAARSRPGCHMLRIRFTTSGRNGVCPI